MWHYQLEVLAITVIIMEKVPLELESERVSGEAQTVWSPLGWRLLEASQTQKTSLNSRRLRNIQFDEYYKNPAVGFRNIWTF